MWHLLGPLGVARLLVPSQGTLGRLGSPPCCLYALNSMQQLYFSR